MRVPNMYRMRRHISRTNYRKRESERENICIGSRGMSLFRDTLLYFKTVSSTPLTIYIFVRTIAYSSTGMEGSQWWLNTFLNLVELLSGRPE